MEKNTNFKALDELVQSLGISEKEISEWFELFKSRKRPGISPLSHTTETKLVQKTSAIRTPLPIVYKISDKMEVSNFLDLHRKNEVWGYQLPCGVFVNKTITHKNGTWYDPEASCDNAKRFAEDVTFNGKKGKLPSKKSLANNQDSELLAEETIKILKANGIRADKYSGVIWCYDDNTFYRHNLIFKAFTKSKYFSCNERFAVSFQD